MAGLFGNVSAEGGFDQSEIDFVTQLINSGQTTIDEVSSTFGVPRDVVASVYAQNAPAAQPSTAEQAVGLFQDVQKANTLANAAKDIYSGLTTTAPAAAANVPYQSPYAINLGGADAAVVADPTATFTGGLSSAVGALSGQESPAETAGLAVLSAFNPAAALAYRIFDAMDLFGGGGLKATEMTPEEALKYAGESRLANTLQGAGEGAGELILDAVEQAEAAGVTPEEIAETLNTRGDLASELIGLTVGSNQMFTPETLADAAAAEETVDLTADTTASDLEEASEALESATSTVGTTADANVAQNGSTGVSGGVTDVQETWNYDKGTDSFISTTTGESVARTGDPDVALKDGGEYSVRPVLGTEGVTAEQVVDVETNKPVGNFVIDVLTGLPTLKKITGAADEIDETVITDTTDTAVDGTVDVGPAAPTGVDDSGTATGGGISVTGTLSDDTYAGVSRNGGGTLDLNVADTVTNGGGTVTVVGADGQDGADGRDGRDGTDGRDGRDGKDGRDGLTGLLALSSIATPIADEIFTREFKMDYLKPEFIGLLDLNKGRTS